MNQKKRFLFIILPICIFLVFITILLCNVRILLVSRSYHVSAISELPQVQAIIVLGAHVRPNQEISWVLKDRMDTGIKLYMEGKGQKLLLTGDHGQGKYNEVQAMKDYALKAGVPEEDIFMDHAGFNTYSSLYRARDVFEVSNAIVVTQDFHLPRALYIGKALGLDVVGYESEYFHYVWYHRSRIREWFARVKAIFDVHVFKSEPKYLGDVISIEGDGRTTQD